MPNHCHNDLYISGPTDEVAALLKLVGADQTPPAFDFSAVIPYPENFRKLDEDSKTLGRAAFYEWCVSNWGTKWDAYKVARRDYLGPCITFQTAWAPPEPVVVALHKLFPKCSLHLECFECGAGYAGGFSLLAEDDWYDDEEAWEAGKKTAEWQGEYCGYRGG